MSKLTVVNSVIFFNEATSHFPINPVPPDIKIFLFFRVNLQKGTYIWWLLILPTFQSIVITDDETLKDLS